jgi:hypothetical protein
LRYLLLSYVPYSILTIVSARIPDIREARKSTDLLLIVVVVVLGVLSFGLGRLSATGTSHATVAHCTYTPLPQHTSTSSPLAVPETGKYVASKNSEVYHLPWCSGAQRIADKNKIWFPTETDAVAAGYRPAANCPGL